MDAVEKTQNSCPKPWLLECPVGGQVSVPTELPNRITIQRFPAFCEIRKTITVFTTRSQRKSSRAKWIQFISSHASIIYLRSIWVLISPYALGLTSGISSRRNQIQHNRNGRPHGPDLNAGHLKYKSWLMKPNLDVRIWVGIFFVLWGF